MRENEMKPEAAPESGSPEDLLRQVRARIADDGGWRGRLRSLSTPARLLVCVLVLACTALAVVFLLRRSDLGAYPALRMVVSLLLLVAFAVATIRFFLRPLQQRGPHIAWAGAWALLGLALPVVLALLPEAHGLVHEHPASFEGRGDDFWPRAAACLLFGVVTALPLAGLLLLVDRRDDVALGRAALVAGVAGLAGNLVLLLHCPLVARGHLVAGHATVGVAFLVLLLPLVLFRIRKDVTPGR